MQETKKRKLIQLLSAFFIVSFLTVNLVSAALTATFSNTVWQVPTFKADSYYVGSSTKLANSTGIYAPEIYRNGIKILTTIGSWISGNDTASAAQTLNTVGGWIVGNATAGTVTKQASAYDYIVFKVGTTYYANSTTGGTNYKSASFVTTLNSVNTALSSGGSVYIKSGIYTYGVAFSLGGRDNITWAGDADTIIRANATIATAGFRILGTGNTNHDFRVTVSGITFDNNLLTSGPYFKWVDELLVQNCRVLNTVNASLRGGITIAGTASYPCLNVRVINNYVNFAGGPGISMSYVSRFNINDNQVHNACQYDYPAGGSIKTDAGVDYGTINDNTLTGTSKNDGIYVGSSTGYVNGYTINDNSIILTDKHNSATSGIKFFANDTTCSGNTIWIAGTADGSVGIHTTGSNNIISSNRIRGGGTAWAGIYMEDAAGVDYNNLVCENIISGFDGFGINCEYDYNSFRNNVITLVPVGLAFTASAAHNGVIGDNYEGCTADYTDAGSNNTFNCFFNESGTYAA